MVHPAKQSARTVADVAALLIATICLKSKAFDPFLRLKLYRRRKRAESNISEVGFPLRPIENRFGGLDCPRDRLLPMQLLAVLDFGVRFPRIRF